MKTKIVYQIDRAGVYQGETQADASPLEPGVWIMPALTVETPPPTEYSSDKWPRWNGSTWELTSKPRQSAPAADADPISKLQQFLAMNPDVAAMLATSSTTDSRG